MKVIMSPFIVKVLVNWPAALIVSVLPSQS